MAIKTISLSRLEQKRGTFYFSSWVRRGEKKEIGHVDSSLRETLAAIPEPQP
jgi:hypothetical protein